MREAPAFVISAGWTGLEPAASGVTGRRYNQLNYHPRELLLLVVPSDSRASLRARLNRVGGTGFEPAATGL